MIEEKTVLTGLDLRHKMLDSRVSQMMLLHYLRRHGFRHLHGSKLSLMLNGKEPIPEKLGAALESSIDKLKRL